MPERSPLAERLGLELRRIRKAAGLPQSDLMSRQATVSDIETGERLPDEEQLELWLRHASSEDERQVVALFNAARSETRVWASLLAEDPTLQRTAAEENAGARRARFYQVGVVPGLLQTPDYARAVFEKLGRADVTASTTERILRQQVLYEPGRSFEFLVLARVLDCAVAPHTRSGQLGHLAAVASAQGVSIGVVPEHVLPGSGSFALFTPIDDDTPEYVSLESPAGLARVSVRATVEAYEREWERLWSAAETGDAAVEVIRAAMR